MQLPSDQIEYRKRIGYVGNKPVIEIGVIGGLKIVGLQLPTGKVSTLGVGSHRAIARYIAKKTEPELKIDELEKSEDAKYEDFKDMLKVWEDITTQVKSLRHE